MSTHRSMDRICAAAAVLSLLLTLLFMNGQALGLASAGGTIGYEERLFDASRVHTIEIVIDDWEEFLSTCPEEEYSVCSVVIDGESCGNVGIRGKGNTSLSSVAGMGSSRYSFKLEFDHYDSACTYHGLDKLSLNNLIQDNTMMKDYLTYQMMNAFGVPSPLSSFAYLTVNGEDWGLYLAVEGVEESFLQRNYGGGYGALYKPDSMRFGGGRGNGRDFDMEDLADRSGGEPGSGGFTPPSMPDGGGPESGEAPPSGEAAPGGFDPSSLFGGGGFGFGGSSDVKLQYIDDDPASYANIFDNAKTGVSDADQARLIDSLRSLSAYKDLEEVLDTEAVLRYFVVHSFVVNGDSYTGSMIHNYYLYEEDGRLSMIPWDYNLAFGTFTAGAADAAVNDAIDEVLSDRPMQAWIFSSEDYAQRYHALYAEFLNTVDPERIVGGAYALIADYVEKDPTKFCTYEEFETGVQALRDFCALRRESAQGQLAGTVPSTGEGQTADPDALIDAGGLDLTDMGTMNNGGGPGGRGGQDAPPASGGPGGAPGDTGGAPSAPDGQAERPSGGPPGGGDFSPPDGQEAPAPQSSALLTIGWCALILLIGLGIAVRYKR